MSRDNVEAWRLKPCSATWTMGSRPCRWFAYGTECERPWTDLVTNWELVVLVVSEGTLSCAFACLARLLRSSRRRGGPWNDFERAVLFCACGTVAQAVVGVDPTGSAGRLPAAARETAEACIRYAFELALFQLLCAYHKAREAQLSFRISIIDPPRVQRCSWFGIAAAVAAAHHATFYALMARFAVPDRGRPGCTHTVLNLLWHAGAICIEIGAIALCVWNALSVRAQLAYADPGSPRGLRANNRVRRSIVVRLSGLAVPVVFILLYAGGILVPRAIRDLPFRCQQPACTGADYLATIWWVFPWLVCTWVAVLVTTAGKDPRGVCCCGSTTDSQILASPRSSSFCYSPRSPRSRHGSFSSSRSFSFTSSTDAADDDTTTTTTRSPPLRLPPSLVQWDSMKERQSDENYRIVVHARNLENNGVVEITPS